VSRQQVYGYAVGIACGLIMWVIGVINGLGIAIAIGQGALN